MLTVADARTRILAAAPRVGAEQVMLTDAFGRVLAEDVRARRTQPPAALSAMDGYAVRSADVATNPVTLKLIGEAPAGRSFPGTVGPGETVRIFTGGPLPAGTDAVVIQEDTTADGTAITMRESPAPGRHVRKAGIDFREGDIGLKAGRCLTARDVALAAAMNLPWLPVRRRPRVALLPTGDEIVLPGEPIGPDQIVGSTGPALAGLVQASGGVATQLSVARDTIASLEAAVDSAAGYDVLVTIGGASVGDHDLVQKAMKPLGLDVGFWKIAMRPGKPLMFGKLGNTLVLGLPGNPVSSMVCAALFLAPLLRTMLGRPDAVEERRATARLAVPMGQNDQREDYVRAVLERRDDGSFWTTPYPVQDSSMLRPLAGADCLIVRPPHASAAPDGTIVPVLLLD